MNPDWIAIGFRQEELQRRIKRQKQLINEIALQNERLTDFDIKVDSRAKQLLQEQVLENEKAIQPSYWKRLWAAICGK
jgi:hypothetical protein